MIIAFIALLAALSGTAIALPGKNRVDSGDIKNNSVKSADIGKGQVKNSDLGANSVNSAKIRSNAVTGSDVNEGSLGQVPSANSANSADTANRATSAANVDKLKTTGSYRRVTSSATNNDPDLARAAATEVPLMSSGPLRVYGKCYSDTDGAVTFSDVFVHSSQPGSILSSVFNTLVGAPTFLDPGTDEALRRVVQAAAGDNNAGVFPPWTDDFAAAAPGGSSINGSVHVAAKHGTLPGGNGLYGEGNVCLFSGFLVD